MFDTVAKCGYLKIGLNTVWDGRAINDTESIMTDGMIAYPNGVDAEGNIKLTLKTVATDLFTVREVTEIYDGIPAYDLVVKAVEGPVYFIKSQHDYNDSEAFDTTKYGAAPGALVEAHPLQVGETIVVSAAYFDAAVEAGTDVHPNAGKMAA